MRALGVAACAAAIAVLAVAPARADQVVAGDLVVQGATCVGFDCVDGEAFGTDVFRLKENNVRTMFDDTSTIGPSNDWQLTANDSASGGQNFFALNDITHARTPLRVMAGAPTGALRVGADGAVGALAGPWLQPAAGSAATALDGDALLAAARALPSTSYRFADEPVSARHMGPTAAQLNAAFGVGTPGGDVAVSDLAGAALAVLKEIAARSQAQGLVVGPQGAAGATGAPGAAGAPGGPGGPGAPGAAGPAGDAPAAASVAALERRIAALDRSQKALSQRNAALAKRIKKAR